MEKLNLRVTDLDGLTIVETTTHIGSGHIVIRKNMIHRSALKRLQDHAYRNTMPDENLDRLLTGTRTVAMTRTKVCHDFGCGNTTVIGRIWREIDGPGCMAIDTRFDHLLPTEGTMIVQDKLDCKPTAGGFMRGLLVTENDDVLVAPLHIRGQIDVDTLRAILILTEEPVTV